MENQEFFLVNFYIDYRWMKGERKKKDNVIGSCHVLMNEENISLRGIMVLLVKATIKFQIPRIRSYTIEGERVSFPVFEFIENQKTNRLYQFLLDNAVPLITERIKENSGEKTQKKLEKIKKTE